MQINATPRTELVSPVRPVKERLALHQEEAPKPAPAVEKTEEEFDKADNLNKLKEVLAEHNISLNFRRDEETKAMVVELVNDKTGEAIRQIPSEISLKLTAVFVKMQGQFIDKTE